VSGESARAAFYGVGRSRGRALGPAPDAAWLSYTDTLAFRVPAGYDLHAAPRPAEQESRRLDEYVRDIAADPAIALGDIELSESTSTPAPGVLQHEAFLRPERLETRCSMEQIADFLFALEAGSPAVRVTHLKVFRGLGVTGDDFTERAWSFEAELSVRRAAR
jgi:hypothetical protein